MSAAPHITVLIPAYNRARLLLRALDSVAAQSLREFEIVVIDDGSTDDTATAVAEWARNNPAVALQYERQANSGQHAAHNLGVKRARGELVMMLDSDDLLLPDALERYWRQWTAIPASARAGFLGVAGHGAWLASRRIQGSAFPQPVFDSSFLEIKQRLGVRGDKFGAYRRELLLDHPYPVFEGERRFRMSYVIQKLSLDYRIRFVDEVFHLIDQQADGLSSNTLRKRLMAPQSLAWCFRDEANRFTVGYGFKLRLQAHERYVRHALHAGKSFAQQWTDIAHHGLLLLAWPVGLVKWLRDLAYVRLGWVQGKTD